ncbi:MAG TPA: hypothetical protein VK468_04070 [Pyrinomonadaceae bacterium]|nr:hypothetical protein [Pyrinomonadaceae bacterium]
MKDKFKWGLSGAWLTAAVFTLILPVFLPSFPNPCGIAGGPIGIATTAMFVLSFPVGLLGLPLSFVAQLVAGIDPDSIQGMYLNVRVLFVLGLVQWFGIVPLIWKRSSRTRKLTLETETLQALPEGRVPSEHVFFDSAAPTPVERVINPEHDD